MAGSPFAAILRPELDELASYVPNPGEFAVRLDANEAPPLLSPEARSVIEAALGGVSWNRYPDARATALREVIAERSGVRPDEVLAGVGSDEVIALLLTALDRPRERAPAATMLTIAPTFVM